MLGHAPNPLTTSRPSGEPRYYGIADLRRLLHADLFVMLAGYLDESQSPEGFFTVSGMVGETDRWERFETGWRRALQRVHVSEFHASQFEARRGEFAGWREPYRKRFVDQLVSLLANLHPLNVGVAVPLSDYNALPAEDRRILGSPGALCAYRCFELVAAWLDRHDSADDAVSYVVDEGGGYAGELMAAWLAVKNRPAEKKRLHWGGISFQDSRTIVPLQAADWAAYESAKQVRVHLELPRDTEGEVWQPRWTIQTYAQRVAQLVGPEHAKALFVSDLLDASQLALLVPFRKANPR